MDKAKVHEVMWQQVSEVFDAARQVDECSFVYCIGEQDDGPIKIGVAKDPIARLRGMQTGNSRRLRVERVLFGHRTLEKLLHEFYESFAIFTPANDGKPDAFPGTEWFRSEIREVLFPIIDTAAHQQAEYARSGDDLEAEEMERIVRAAHGAHGHVAEVRGEARFLAQGAGNVIRRPSRVS